MWKKASLLSLVVWVREVSGLLEGGGNLKFDLLRNSEKYQKINADKLGKIYNNKYEKSNFQNELISSFRGKPQNIVLQSSPSKKNAPKYIVSTAFLPPQLFIQSSQNPSHPNICAPNISAPNIPAPNNSARNVSKRNFMARNFSSRNNLKTRLSARFDGAAPCGDKDSLQMKQEYVDEPGEVYELWVLGSTGSIGRQTLEVVSENDGEESGYDLRVTGLAAGGGSLELLADQVVQFRPRIVAIADATREASFRELLWAKIRAQFGPKIIPSNDDYHLQKNNLVEEDDYFRMPTIVSGLEGVNALASSEGCVHGSEKVIVSGIVGVAGLSPTLSGIYSGKKIALANKETLISAGPVMLDYIARYNTVMTPADSEHSAIFQCLEGCASRSEVRRLLLTASGGAFRDWTKSEMSRAGLEDALKHPNWSMGPKITVDSSTLMNKGLEVIEAHYLFGIDYDDIEILIHPESIVHSMVEFTDTSIMAQMGIPNMKLPLLHSILWPRRGKTKNTPLNLISLKNGLNFKSPSFSKYPCLGLAYQAGKEGGLAPAILNAANEIANQKFRNKQLTFAQIPQLINSVLQKWNQNKHSFTQPVTPHNNNHNNNHNIINNNHNIINNNHNDNKTPTQKLTIEDVIYADNWARQQALQIQL